MFLLIGGDLTLNLSIHSGRFVSSLVVGRTKVRNLMPGAKLSCYYDCRELLSHSASQIARWGTDYRQIDIVFSYNYVL